MHPLHAAEPLTRQDERILIPEGALVRAEGALVLPGGALVLPEGAPVRAEGALVRAPSRQAMRVPGGSARDGVRVRAHAHHSSSAASATCTPSPTNQLGTVSATVCSGVV